jgi:hypothetical protein
LHFFTGRKGYFARFMKRYPISLALLVICLYLFACNDTGTGQKKALAKASRLKESRNPKLVEPKAGPKQL